MPRFRDHVWAIQHTIATLGWRAAVATLRDQRPPIARVVARILIIDDLRAAAAVFLNALRTCALSARYLAGGNPRVQPAMAAWLLVHEAGHARLDRLHPLPWWPGLSARMERRAMREELDFVARLPRPTYDFMREWLPGRIAQDRHATPQLRAAACGGRVMQCPT